MEPHRVVLQKHMDTVVKKIVQSGQTKSIIYELFERKVLEESVVQSLMRDETTETNRVRHMIFQLQQGGSEAFSSFASVLKEVGLQEEGDLLVSSHNDKEGNGNDVIDNQSRVMPSIHSEAGNTPYAGDDDAQYNNNIEEPFEIRVIPSADFIMNERDNRDVYKNSSMPRGLVFLANYKIFKNDEHPVRNGSEKDVKNLSLLFNGMGYKIPFQHHNLTRLDTHRKLKEFAELPQLGSVDSCIVVIMSHGRDEESFYAHDNQVVKNQEVIDYFNNLNCPNLRGKPKIFIFQHCRGRMQDFGVHSPVDLVANVCHGLPVEMDGGSKGSVRVYSEPTYTDMFLIYSTLGGFVSFRHPDRGSWLIEAICWVFMKQAYMLDLDALMKKVSQVVRKNYADGGERQICETVNRGFDRHFFFNPVPYNENLNSMETTAISRGLSNSRFEESVFPVGVESPSFSYLRSKHRGISPTRRASWDAWSRNRDPTMNRLYPRECNLSSSRRHRHSSGGSSPSLECSTEDLRSPSDSCISARLYSHLGYQNGLLQENNIEPNDNQYGWSRTISEPAPGHWIPDPNGASNYPTAEKVVFPNIEEHHEAIPSSPGMDYDVIDYPIKPKLKDSAPLEDLSDLTNTLEASSIQVTEERSVEIISKIEDTTGIKLAEKTRLKRQLSILSSRETLANLHKVKKFFQVNETPQDALDKVMELEKLVLKQLEDDKKKKRKIDRPYPSSLEY